MRNVVTLSAIHKPLSKAVISLGMSRQLRRTLSKTLSRILSNVNVSTDEASNRS